MYVSATKTLWEEWTAQVGMRYEATGTRGKSVTINSVKDNSFDNFFPSAYVLYEPNENNAFSVSYSRRIERPTFAEVNPFKVYLDFYSYEMGNPDLKPSLIDNIELGHVFKNNL